MTQYSMPAARSPGRTLNIVLWVLQLLLALAFIGASLPKLTGKQMMVDEFARLGLGQWFRYFTGCVEILGAILLLVPRLCGVGALLLTMTMIGAVTAHLTRLGGNPAPAIVLLLISAFVAWGRRDRTLMLIGKH